MQAAGQPINVVNEGGACDSRVRELPEVGVDAQTEHTRISAPEATRILVGHTDDCTEPVLGRSEEPSSGEVNVDDVDEDEVVEVNGRPKTVALKTFSKVRKMYRLPERYAQYLKKYVLGNPDCERMEVLGLIISDFGFTGHPLPDDFSTESQVRRRVTGLKYHQKKKDARSDENRK